MRRSQHGSRAPVKAPVASGAPEDVPRMWRLMEGPPLHICSGTTCIAAEGEGVHDGAAVPRQHVRLPPPVVLVEVRHWAEAVWHYARHDRDRYTARAAATH